ncbi:hypothetical protein RRF57_011448 [Xylaria bambusicola]|uniref:Nudix hydrolase domain-containing protein n=1 Tax=Xylaria bambusicola TaxID=326684 RepID=A0AAN7ZD74_9PEZI
MSLTNGKVTSSELLASAEGRWIKLVKLTYNDSKNETRTWESAERTTRAKGSGVDGAPLNKITIELPAGLVDEGESVQEAAVRELKEETGFVGTVSEMSPIMFNEDPGMTNTNTAICSVQIDVTLPENQDPKPSLEDDEFIETFTTPLATLYAECKRLEAEGYAIDARVGTFAQGIELTKRMNFATQSHYFEYKMSSPRLIAIIGATGAQGIPVVRELLQSGNYAVRVLTRDTNSERFKELQSYGAVESVIGTFASEESLRATFHGAWGVFVNIDGFNSGEKTEIFWTIREGVKFYVHGNIDYAYKKSGFRPEFHCGHIDAKGRMADWILAQDKDVFVQSRMRSAVFTTGPYIEMTIGRATPFPPSVENGVAIWRAPLDNGAVPFTALDDVGVYVMWLFDHAGGEADGIEVQASIAHITFDEYVRAFEKVLGKPAKWIDVDLEEHLENNWGKKADWPAGYNADPNDPATMTIRQNFRAWFKVYQNSGENKGIVRRDYDLIDRIFPGRIRSVEEWIRRENENGLKKGLGSLWDRIQPENLGHVLKLSEDQRQGKL